MQTDIEHASDEFVKANKALKPVIDDMMRKGGYDSFDDLYNKALEKMTPDDRKKFEAVSRASRKYHCPLLITQCVQLIDSARKMGQVSVIAQDGQPPC